MLLVFRDCGKDVPSDELQGTVLAGTKCDSFSCGIFVLFNLFLLQYFTRHFEAIRGLDKNGSYADIRYAKGNVRHHTTLSFGHKQLRSQSRGEFELSSWLHTSLSRPDVPKLVSHFEIHQWQTQFEAGQKRDHDEIIEYLSEIQNSQTITNEVLADNASKLTAIMSMMQNVPIHLNTMRRHRC
jgi:hypothetical protein